MSDATFYRRLAVGGLVLAYMQWGPIAHQLLGQKVGPGMMTWRMYYGAARDVCDVRYYAVGQDGSRTFVDRFAALGHDHFWEAGKSVRRIVDRAHIERQGRQICREFLPKGQSLEVDARCASYRGWKREVFDEPLCRGGKGASTAKPKARKAPKGGEE